MLMVMCMALEDSGYRVLTAESAEQALPFLSDPALDVVLSDLKMPGMRGEEFIAHCRKGRPDLLLLAGLLCYIIIGPLYLWFENKKSPL